MKRELFPVVTTLFIKAIVIALIGVVVQDYFLDRYGDYSPIIKGTSIFIVFSALHKFGAKEINQLNEYAEKYKAVDPTQEVKTVNPDNDITAANIQRYKEEIALKKQNKKWWQFWL